MRDNAHHREALRKWHLFFFVFGLISRSLPPLANVPTPSALSPSVARAVRATRDAAGVARRSKAGG